MSRFALAAALLLAATPLLAQETERTSFYDDPRTWGLSAQYSRPYDDYGARYENGFGVQAIVDHPLSPLFSLCGEFGYNRFRGKDDRADIDIWELAAGGRFNLPPFFIGGEAAYYTEIDRLNWVPSVGLRFRTWEVAVRWQAASTTSWISYRVGFYF